MPNAAGCPLPADSFDLLATLGAIGSLHGTVAMARALVLAGRRVDLAGLDRDAARLAAAVVCLPAGTAPSLRAPLEALTREVDLLTQCLPRP